MRIHTRIVLGLVLLSLLSVASCVYACVTAHRLTVVMHRIAAAEGPADADTHQESLPDLRTARNAALVFAGTSVLVTALLAFAAVRTVLPPLQGLADLAGRVSAGDPSAPWRSEDGNELDELGGAIEHMVDRLQARIREVAATNEALERAERETQRELMLAQTVQRSIVPREASAPGLSIFTHFLAARMIGGDFFDIQVIDDPPDRPPRVALTVGDASGHGIPAALVMVLALTSLREAVRRTPEPSEVLARVNHELIEHLSNGAAETFVTASCVIIDAAGGTLRMSSAGNEPPLLWRRCTGEIASLETVGMFLGSFSDSRYQTIEASVAAGDRLLIFSDGLTESRSTSGEFFGRERIEAIVRGAAEGSVTDLGHAILSALHAFSPQAAPRDDVALLIAEVGERGA